MSAHPVRERDTVFATPAVARRLAANPAVTIHSVSYLPDRRVKLVITYTDHTAQLPRQPRWAIYGWENAVATAAVIGAALGALYMFAQIVWTLWADPIITLLRFGGAAIVAVIGVVVLAWFTNHGRHGCPGLHCRGCGGR